MDTPTTPDRPDPDLDLDDEPDVGLLREIASEWHGGQGSALCAFASTGTLLPRILHEIQTCLSEVADRPGAYEPDRELPRLHALSAYAHATIPHHHIGHDHEGRPPIPSEGCYQDPTDALADYVAMIHGFAEHDDHGAWSALAATATPDDYPCLCGHEFEQHRKGAALVPCIEPGCDCGIYDVDYGDEIPNMDTRAARALAADTPQAGQDHTITLTDYRGDNVVFWLRAVPAHTCTGTRP